MTNMLAMSTATGTQAATGSAAGSQWKLQSPPETPVNLDENVLAMHSPLVRVRCEQDGSWTCVGPQPNTVEPAKTSLSAVVSAWPHVAGLSALTRGGCVVWSWRQQGWAEEDGCQCGQCETPVATDIDRSVWPEDLQAHSIVSVENVALTGQTPLTDILHTSGGIALLGEGDHRRTSDLMSPVAMANAVRRWPHIVRALRMLGESRGMRWDFDELKWHEYLIA